MPQAEFQIALQVFDRPNTEAAHTRLRMANITGLMSDMIFRNPARY